MSAATKIQKTLEEQLSSAQRHNITMKSLENYGAIIVTADLTEAVRIANQIAPEHLELLVRQPEKWALEIRNAGAIFIGPYSAPPLNHVLPTGGSARFFSPLGTYDFLKRTTVIHAEKRALLALAPQIIQLARLEGLDNHARAVEARFVKEG
jgi:histidinol dehydrogenase